MNYENTKVPEPAIALSEKSRVKVVLEAKYYATKLSQEAWLSSEGVFYRQEIFDRLAAKRLHRHLCEPLRLFIMP